MTSGSTGSEGIRWVLQPPPGKVYMHVAIGQGAQLTPRVEAALEQLIRRLQQADVEGVASPCFPRCPALKACGEFECVGYHNCYLAKGPCLVDTVCAIG